MGRKGQKKSHGAKSSANVDNQSDGIKMKKLSPQKRNELNQLIEKLMHKCSVVLPNSSPSKDWDDYVEIYSFIERIRAIEADFNPPPFYRSDHIQQFLLWLKSNNAEIDGVEIARFDGYGFGLKTTKELKEGDVVMRIPRKVMLTIESAKESPIGVLIEKDIMLQSMPNVALALHLLTEKHNPASFWAPYIFSMPSKYTTVLYFKPEEMRELKGSPALDEALKQYKNIARQYAYFYKLFQNVILRDVITYDEYRWAVSTVMTRQNTIPSTDGNTMINALIPLWDMCNHCNGMISTDFNLEADTSQCYAFKSFKEGEQFFIFYGVRTNCDMLIHNGFTYPDNEHDSLAIKLGVSKNDDLYSAKSELLTHLGVPVSGTFHLQVGSKPVDGRLLAFLRVFCMNKELLEHWMKNDKYADLVYEDCSLETEVENKGWNFLLTRASLLLKAYPTSIEEDESRIQGNLSYHSRLGIQLGLAEKKMLHNTVKYAEEHIRN